MEGETSYHWTGRGDSTRHCYLERGDKRDLQDWSWGSIQTARELAEGVLRKKTRNLLLDLLSLRMPATHLDGTEIWVGSSEISQNA